MLFNSLEFLLFIVVVFFSFWFLLKNDVKKQNILILVSSYVFYGWWDYRFLFLIAFSTFLDFFISQKIAGTEIKKHKKKYLFLSFFVNLGLLFVFKYCNFFIESFQELSSSLGFQIKVSTLNVILPVGISFYTFQTLSYTIDVYREKLKPTNDFIAFASFVTFFPQLVAGPIERATNLLPQFYKKREFSFEFAKSGVQLIIWGLFKKVVIADSCAVYVDYIFSEYDSMNSLTLILGAIYFAFQIYGDFSGYTDIAIGTGRLLGFNLLTNFKTPYFSRDIAEFWRRWHISLTTWFKDYVYIPLGGSRGNIFFQLRNVFIIFLISGFWHGANWTYLFWGGINAMYFLPLLLFNKNKRYTDEIKFSFSSVLKMIFTFTITCFSWIFFRADSLSIAFGYIQRILDFNFSHSIKYLSIDRYNVEMLPLILLFIVFELIGVNKETPLLGKFSYLKTIMVLLLIFVLGVFSNQKDFIYFQF